MDLKWLETLDASIIVCDPEGIITFMNPRAGEMFKEQGGMGLVGKSMYDCHPENANVKVREMMKTRKPNTYTTEKNGKKKMVWQSPWEKDGKFAGLVEIVLPIPLKYRTSFGSEVEGRKGKLEGGDDIR